MDNKNVKELSFNEMTEIYGGYWQAALAVMGAAIYIYNNWDDFVRGFKDAQR